jgi:putative exporter of polyketide antibiotics
VTPVSDRRAPVVVMVAVALITAGQVAFRRRDVITS